MTEPDPRRLLDEEPEGPLRDALEVAREQLPTDEQLASLATKLGPLLGGGPGGGAPTDGGGGGAAGTGGATATTAGVAAKGTVLGKAAVALLAAGVVGAGAWAVLDREPEPQPTAHRAPSTPQTTPESQPTPPVETPTPPDDAPPTPPPTEETRANPPPQNLPGRFRDPPGKRPGSSPPGEVPLLEQAQDALAADPARALELAEEHRRHHPEGMLAQEREVLAIDALLRLGRRGEAEARAGRFRERYPGSAQRRRIDTLLGR